MTTFTRNSSLVVRALRSQQGTPQGGDGEGRPNAGIRRRTILILMVLSFCASVAKRVDSVDNCPKVGTIDHGRSPRTGLATMNALTTLQLSLRALVRAALVPFVLLQGIMRIILND